MTVRHAFRGATLRRFLPACTGTMLTVLAVAAWGDGGRWWALLPLAALECLLMAGGYAVAHAVLAASARIGSDVADRRGGAAGALAPAALLLASQFVPRVPVATGIVASLCAGALAGCAVWLPARVRVRRLTRM